MHTKIGESGGSFIKRDRKIEASVRDWCEKLSNFAVPIFKKLTLEQMFNYACSTSRKLLIAFITVCKRLYLK